MVSGFSVYKSFGVQRFGLPTNKNRDEQDCVYSCPPSCRVSVSRLPNELGEVVSGERETA